jgi:hypothetical protein
VTCRDDTSSNGDLSTNTLRGRFFGNPPANIGGSETAAYCIDLCNNDPDGPFSFAGTEGPTGADCCKFACCSSWSAYKSIDFFQIAAMLLLFRLATGS